MHISGTSIRINRNEETRGIMEEKGRESDLIFIIMSKKIVHVDEMKDSRSISQQHYYQLRIC